MRPSSTTLANFVGSVLSHSVNRWIYAEAYAPPLGTLPPLVTMLYIPRTLSEMPAAALKKKKIWESQVGG